MYPRISDFFKDHLGFDLPFPIYSYGFMVAVAILTASWITGRELKRLQSIGRLGKFPMTMRRKGGGTETVQMQPSDLMGTVTIIAAIAGIIGAKLFYVLEEPGNMMEKLFSSGGLTFYGGLLGGAAAVMFYVRSKKIPSTIFMDAIAPSMILGYGIGRIGCHLAGDGDWGIPSNMAAKPSFIPTWLWAETYPNNIMGAVIPPSYPTPLWEFLACTAFFAILWMLRKHPFKAGWLFSLYLCFNGIERFMIEKLRLNIPYNIWGMKATQAEIIAMILFSLGVIGLMLTTRRREDAPQNTAVLPKVGSTT